MFLETAIGIGLAPVIRAFVGYVKPAWAKAGNFAPIISTLCAVVTGIVLAAAWQAYSPTPDQTVAVTVAIGTISGFAAILYNDSRMSLEANQTSQG